MKQCATNQMGLWQPACVRVSTAQALYFLKSVKRQAFLKLTADRVLCC